MEQNLTSALIIEDDADWDIRIKSQLIRFARASRALVQPERNLNNTSIDPTNPRKSASDEAVAFSLDVDSVINEPTTSPYGDVDRWDVLWLGHCGTRFPRPEDTNIPLARVFIADDETVPEPQHIAKEWGNTELYEEYDPHTRVVHREAENVCTLAYALTLAGARRLLYELSINKITTAYDLMLREMCEGNGRRMRTCLTVQPQLFQHHRPRGLKKTFSEISDHGNDTNPTAHTLNIRWSTRVNLAKLADGDTDYIDQYPDGAPAPPWVDPEP